MRAVIPLNCLYALLFFSALTTARAGLFIQPQPRQRMDTACRGHAEVKPRKDLLSSFGCWSRTYINHEASTPPHHRFTTWIQRSESGITRTQVPEQVSQLTAQILTLPQGFEALISPPPRVIHSRFDTLCPAQGGGFPRTPVTEGV